MLSSGPEYVERWVTAQDGLRLYARDYGDPLAPGTPVLCLTGLTRNSQDYDDLAKRLCDRRRVVCPDYRGRGRSAYDPDWRNYRPDVYVRDLMNLLAALSLHRVVICGTSLGGLLAMGLSVATPSAVAGAVLNDIGPELNPDGVSRILDYVGRDTPQKDWDGAVSHLKQLFGADSHDTEAKWRRFAEATYKRRDDGLLHYDWDVNLAKPLIRNKGETPNLWSLYGALARRPVLALRGEKSDVLNESTFARMAEVKPDLIRVTLLNVGHAPELDEPLAEEAIDSFLADLDTREPH